DLLGLDQFSYLNNCVKVHVFLPKLFLSLTLVIQELESGSLWIYFNYIDQLIVALIPDYKVGNRPLKFNPEL
ncbi:uncharacterized protein METZ01_LOCUS310134, partial [marine metagenome]